MRDGDSSVESVAERLVLLRQSRGFDSQAAFAQRTGIGIPELNHYERSRRLLTLVAANKIRMHWNVTLDWLYHGDRSGLSVEVASSLPLLADWRRQKRA